MDVFLLYICTLIRIGEQEDGGRMEREERSGQWHQQIFYYLLLFQVIRYGRNINLKENTENFVGDYQEVIERFSSLRDLGVEINEEGTFTEHIENICKKSQTEKRVDPKIILHQGGRIYETYMFNTLVQPKIYYCSQLYMPLEGKNLEKIEKLLGDYTRKIPGKVGLNWLSKLRNNSEQRRLERYQVIYTWKTMEGLTPNCGVNWSSTTERNGRTCKIPPVKGRNSVQTLRNQSFQVSGPRLFNSMPKNIRNINNCSLEDFKCQLDAFLNKVPDEPKSQDLIPRATNIISGKQTNSLIYQVAKI